MRPPKLAGGGREGSDKEDAPVKTRHVTFQLEPESEVVKAEAPPRGSGQRKKLSVAKGRFPRKDPRGWPTLKKEKVAAGGAGSGK